jgi:ElaA protein
MELNWTFKKFEDLSPEGLYAALRLRSEVFVVEQNCAYLDEDNKDLHAWHLLGWNEKDLVAYVRILPPGLPYPFPSIGRVVTSPAYRGTGSGRKLMAEAIQRTYSLHGDLPIKIGAQLYLKKFYQSFGFEQTSEIYLEDGIDHIEMIKP